MHCPVYSFMAIRVKKKRCAEKIGDFFCAFPRIVSFHTFLPSKHCESIQTDWLSTCVIIPWA